MINWTKVFFVVMVVSICAAFSCSVIALAYNSEEMLHYASWYATTFSLALALLLVSAVID